MTLTFVPLLLIQRRLYDLPRNMERFNKYIATMRDGATGNLRYPLVAMNPMGKEHVPALLDDWIALGADEFAQRAVADAATGLQSVPGEFKVGLVIADDLKGGWTNRHLYDFAQRYHTKGLHRRGWVTGLLWTSETPSAEAAREAAVAGVYRAAWIQQHGYASTLRQLLAQEGYAMANAGSPVAALDADDLAYTREAIAGHLDATDQHTIMACLYGDQIATSLGYPPLGFSRHAGFALALDQARSTKH